MSHGQAGIIIGALVSILIVLILILLSFMALMQRWDAKEIRDESLRIKGMVRDEDDDHEYSFEGDVEKSGSASGNQTKQASV